MFKYSIHICQATKDSTVTVWRLCSTSAGTLQWQILFHNFVSIIKIAIFFFVTYLTVHMSVRHLWLSTLCFSLSLRWLNHPLRYDKTCQRDMTWHRTCAMLQSLRNYFSCHVLISSLIPRHLEFRLQTTLSCFFVNDRF